MLLSGAEASRAMKHLGGKVDEGLSGVHVHCAPSFLSMGKTASFFSDKSSYDFKFRRGLTTDSCIHSPSRLYQNLVDGHGQPEQGTRGSVL